jgi:hypothetical protein
MKSILNSDIIKKINADFKKEEVDEVIAIALDMFENISVVGGAQFVRSLLYLANGNLNVFKETIKRAKADPRDIVSEAEDMAGNQGHYFISSFDDIEKGIYDDVWKPNEIDGNIVDTPINYSIEKGIHYNSSKAIDIFVANEPFQQFIQDFNSVQELDYFIDWLEELIQKNVCNFSDFGMIAGVQWGSLKSRVTEWIEDTFLEKEVFDTTEFLNLCKAWRFFLIEQSKKH